MGYPQMFYIDLSVREHLAGVENKSALVNSLLKEHFKSDAPLEQVKTMKERELEELKNILKEKEEAIYKIELVEKQKEEELLNAKDEEERIAKEKLRQKEMNILFEKAKIEELKGILGVEPTSKQANLYLFYLNTGDDKGLETALKNWKKEHNEQLSKGCEEREETS
jgi:hypothetical protein